MKISNIYYEETITNLTCKTKKPRTNTDQQSIGYKKVRSQFSCLDSVKWARFTRIPWKDTTNYKLKIEIFKF